MKKAVLTAALVLMALFVLAPQSAVHAASASFYYKTGYSIQNGWLCYGWSNGTYHCTSHWHYSNGVAISDNPSWVPNVTQPAPQPPPAPSGSVAWQGGSSNHYPWGQCTWGAAHLAYDNVDYLGNAKDWTHNAARRGRPTGTSPRLNATVVFQPGVQGASWQYGHVAHVVRLGSNGSFEVEEMNVSGVAGGGFGRFSYRWVHTGYGVSFIY